MLGLGRKSALKKILLNSEVCRVMMKDDPRGRIIRIYHECQGGIEKSVPRITISIIRLAE